MKVDIKETDISIHIRVRNNRQFFDIFYLIFIPETDVDFVTWSILQGHENLSFSYPEEEENLLSQKIVKITIGCITSKDLKKTEILFRRNPFIQNKDRKNNGLHLVSLLQED